jgi:predicted phage terminase large subunit-like protein
VRFTPEDIRELALLDAELCSKDFHYFVEQAFHILEPKKQFVDGWHIHAICEHMEACLDGQIRELLINIPPRHMKSLIVSAMFNAWVWTKAPDKRFLSSSYASSLSIRDSVKTRRIIQSPWYQSRWGHVFKLTGDQNAKEKFENDQYGYRLATSVGGTGTGEGGDFVLVDDPHKVTEAESDVVRKGVLDWWDEEMSTRENDPKTGVKIIVMQRVHEDDLSGHCVEQGGYVHLMLPAEYEAERKCTTILGWEDPRKEHNELLWPQRFDRETLDKLKRRLGSKATAGQLQQRPSPLEGNVIKRDWWKFYGGDKQPPMPTQFDKIAIGGDLTFKDGEKNDYTVFQVWGRVKQDKYLLDLIRGHMGINEQLIAFKSLVSKWSKILGRVDAKYIEDAANGAALVALMKKEISGIIAVPAKGSKVARAEAIAPQAEAGNLWIPDPSLVSWVGDFIEEWCIFPNGKNDDQVDTTSLTVSKLSEGIGSDWTPISLTGTSKWLR